MAAIQQTFLTMDPYGDELVGGHSWKKDGGLRNFTAVAMRINHDSDNKINSKIIRPIRAYLRQ